MNGMNKVTQHFYVDILVFCHDGGESLSFIVKSDPIS